MSSESTFYGISPDLSELAPGPDRKLVCVAPDSVLHHMLGTWWENNKISLSDLLSDVASSLIVEPFE